MLTEAKSTLEGFDAHETMLRGARLRYLAGGSGPPLVLVHGLGGSAANWADLAPGLAVGRRVIVPELPGHGGSEPLPTAPSLAALAEAVEAVLLDQTATPAPVVGHSLGGVVALQLALLRPDAVSGIVAAASAGISSGTTQARRALLLVGLLRPGKRVARWRRTIARSRRLQRLAFSQFTSDPLSLSPRAVEGLLVAHRAHTDLASARRALVRSELRPELERIACPALVLWGADDRQLPLDDAFEYARRLRAPLRVIPDCGHLLIAERPDACRDAVEAFLACHEL